MSQGPQMPALGAGGPSTGGPNIGLGSVKDLALMPLKLLTNPLGALRTLASFTGGGNNPIDKLLATTSKLTSLLKGNPKILLSEAMGGAKGGGNGGLIGGIADKAESLGCDLVDKSGQIMGKATGKAGGALSEMIGKVIGSVVRMIPIVGPVIEAAVKVGAKVAGKMLEKLGEVAGKIIGKVAKAVLKAVFQTVRKMVGAVVKAAIKAAQKRGPCKAVGARKTVTMKGKKPGILNPVSLAKAITAKVRAAVNFVKRDEGLSKLRKVGQKTVKVGKKIKGGLGGVFRTAQSGMSVAKSGSRMVLKLSEAQGHLAKGDAQKALTSVNDARSAGVSTGKSVTAPGRKLASRAWKGRKSIAKPFGKVLKAVGGRVLATKPGQSLAKNVSKARTGITTAVKQSGVGRMAKSVAQGVSKVGQGIGKITKTVTAPYRWTKGVVKKVGETPIGKTLKAAFKVGQKVTTVAKGTVGAGGQVVGLVKDAGQGVNSLAGAQKSMAQGDVTGALNKTHGGVSQASSAPDRVAGAGSRFGQALQRQAKANPAKPDGAKPEGPKAGEAKAGEAKAGEAKAGEAKAGEAKAGEAKAGEAKAGEAKAGEAKAGEAKAGEAKAGEAKAGEGKAGEGKPGEVKTEGVSLDPVRPGGSPTAEGARTVGAPQETPKGTP